MSSVYLICALVGGTVLVIQFFLTLTGLGADHDLGADMHGGDVGHAGHDYAHDHAHAHEHSSSWFFGIITFRTIVAFLAFFGLGGMAALHGDWSMPGLGDSNLSALVVALLAGLAALFGVHAIMRTIAQLRSDGTVRIERAIGATGTVYLRVPGQRGGAGKVQVAVQNRTMEYSAVTADDDLPTGAKVVVLDIVAPDTLEVAAVRDGG